MASGRWAILRKAYPSHPGPWAQGALAELHLNRLDIAEALLGHASKEFPDHAPGSIIAAKLALKQGDHNRAAALFERSRQHFPKFVHAWLESAEFAAHCGDLDLALGFNQQAMLVAPDAAVAFIQKGNLYMRFREWTSALSAWEDVRIKFPTLKEGYEQGAEAAHQNGDAQLERSLLLEQEYGQDLFEGQGERPVAYVHTNTFPFKRYCSLVWTKALFGLRAEVSRSFLSYGWWVIEPLLHMVVYQIVFGLLLNRGGEDYPVFLLSGLVPWMWVAKSISSGSSSILAGQNLMLQVGLPPVVFPLEVLIKTTLKQVPIFILLFGFVWAMGYAPTTAWWFLFPLILVQGILISAFTLAAAAVLPFVRDLKHLIPTGLMFLMFLSGVFYDYRTIGKDWQDLFLMNPFAFFLKSYREILLYAQTPDIITLGAWGGGGLLACLLLFFLYRSLRFVYPRVLLK